MVVTSRTRNAVNPLGYEGSNPSVSVTEKIDGAVAAIMALDRAIRCRNDTSASVYDDRGILFL